MEHVHLTHHAITRFGRQAAIWIVLVVVSSSAGRSQTFPEVVRQIDTQSDSLGKSRVIDQYLLHTPSPVVHDSCVYFLYRGGGASVAVPGDLNGWNPSVSAMRHLAGTNLFVRADTIPADGRVEYKIWVDSAWMLDPLNPRRAAGGFGENSELEMPGYRPSAIDSLPQGTGRDLDTLRFRSLILHRTHPVYVYTPPGASGLKDLPVIYVTDGGEYLTLAKMDAILDALILSKQIRPVVAVFVDPRTDPHDPSSTQRMTDYSASDSYLDFLERELAPLIEKKYPVSANPDHRLILGASMGGLISTYAVLRRGGFVRNCAAQSPAYLEADSAVIRLLKGTMHVDGEFYIQTGTIHDARDEACFVSRLLEERGARVIFEEFHEGHNWTNWRNKLDRILEHFLRYR